jgi:SAM-dependent methyltransferase
MRIFATDRASQLAYFSSADEEHYRWQTESGYFAQTERALIETAGLPTSGRVLEIGCGDGANLHHLGGRAGWAGIDLSGPKLTHARRVLPGLVFARADASQLPFADATFEGILIRDLLHHVGDRVGVLAEATRVLCPGGTLAVIEPNRASPLIVAQGLLIQAERAVLRSDARRMRRELEEAGLAQVEVRRAQPLPLGRILLHPRLGRALLGNSASIARLLDATDALFRRLVPTGVWMYVVARARKERGSVRARREVKP